ncbi:LuxR C-terminal-related transcriptional regulator [Streptomyces sp. NBS 14/10]|uniref:PAS and helix-turn-helix domain-containing protein n=1 Tax=Streptomyces sp. NBS 14/10 TaxID=1945643 RepID=UPI00211AC4BE|nr:PAS and helix-turn-helix domain-containing protein [Streptomyces sp. NBS 14/10]KAK1177552.1 LuxR C-terminal-related transcriptional regulator [Streptomyces sp. NBS 14/10]
MISHDAGRDQLEYADLLGQFDQPGACVARLDPNLLVQQANQEFFRQFGGSSADVCGRAFCDLAHPSLRQPLKHQLGRLVDGSRRRFATHVVAFAAEGAPFTSALTAVPVRGETSRVASILVVMRSAAGFEDADVVTPHKKVLTEIEARILEGIAAGVSTVPLASRLYLSRQGVEYHVTRLLRKLRVPNRAALVSRAYSMGVLEVGSWPPKVVQDFVK